MTNTDRILADGFPGRHTDHGRALQDDNVRREAILAALDDGNSSVADISLVTGIARDRVRLDLAELCCAAEVSMSMANGQAEYARGIAVPSVLIVRSSDIGMRQ